MHYMTQGAARLGNEQSRGPIRLRTSAISSARFRKVDENPSREAILVMERRANVVTAADWQLLSGSTACIELTSQHEIGPANGLDRGGGGQLALNQDPAPNAQ